MLSDLLDVMRDHGWRETGADHDPVRWLKLTLEEHSGCESVLTDAHKAQREAEDARDAAEEQRDSMRLSIRDALDADSDAPGIMRSRMQELIGAGA